MSTALHTCLNIMRDRFDTHAFVMHVSLPACCFYLLVPVDNFRYTGELFRKSWHLTSQVDQ